jgi:hypothetical protein
MNTTTTHQHGTIQTTRTVNADGSRTYSFTTVPAPAPNTLHRPFFRPPIVLVK